MSRNYKIERRYVTNNIESKNEMDFPTIQRIDNSETTPGMIDVSFQKNVPIDIDIFSELPKEVYEIPKVAFFLSKLKNVILITDLQEVTLSKLHVSNFTEENLTIEWIFNYFRTYFSFELAAGGEDDSYGMIENNPESAQFLNFFRILNISEYEIVASSIVDYIILMGGFK